MENQKGQFELANSWSGSLRKMELVAINSMSHRAGGHRDRSREDWRIIGGQDIEVHHRGHGGHRGIFGDEEEGVSAIEIGIGGIDQVGGCAGKDAVGGLDGDFEGQRIMVKV